MQSQNMRVYKALLFVLVVSLVTGCNRSVHQRTLTENYESKTSDNAQIDTIKIVEKDSVSRTEKTTVKDTAFKVPESIAELDITNICDEIQRQFEGFEKQVKQAGVSVFYQNGKLIVRCKCDELIFKAQTLTKELTLTKIKLSFLENQSKQKQSIKENTKASEIEYKEVKVRYVPFIYKILSTIGVISTIALFIFIYLKSKK